MEIYHINLLLYVYVYLFILAYRMEDLYFIVIARLRFILFIVRLKMVLF